MTKIQQTEVVLSKLNAALRNIAHAEMNGRTSESLMQLYIGQAEAYKSVLEDVLGVYLTVGNEYNGNGISAKQMIAVVGKTIVKTN